jgi:hypothetical protein
MPLMNLPLVTPLLVPLGLVAGALTTVAGLGGGLMLALALTALWDPLSALVVTAPALLAGNTHRVWLYRRETDGRIGGAFALGALPGSLVGGVVAVGLPRGLIHALILVATGLGLARAAGWLRLPPRRAALVPAGAVVGAVCATASGAGVLTAPLIMATGLQGRAYVATSALCSAAMHLGRVAGYAAGGALSSDRAAAAMILGVAIVAGNLAGDRLERRLAPPLGRVIERGVLVVCVALALAGVH